MENKMREYGITTIYKKEYYLRLLIEQRDVYLPPKHKLVQLLDRFLELAEKRCNYILLPNRKMNQERYRKCLDEVPATLYLLFEKDGFGKYFLDGNGEVDNEDVIAWIKREHLEMGFEDDVISQNCVKPLLNDLHPGTKNG